MTTALKEIQWKPGDYAIVKRGHRPTRLVRISKVVGVTLMDESQVGWSSVTGFPVRPFTTLGTDRVYKNQPRIVGRALVKDIERYGTAEQKTAVAGPQTLTMPSGLLDGIEVGQRVIARHPDGSKPISCYISKVFNGVLTDTAGRDWYRETGRWLGGTGKPNAPVIMALGDPDDRMVIGPVEAGDLLVISCPDKSRYTTAVLKVDHAKVMDGVGLYWSRIDGKLLTSDRKRRGQVVIKVSRAAPVVRPALTPTVAELRLKASLETIRVGDTIQLKSGETELVSGITVTPEGAVTKFTTGEPASAVYSVADGVDGRIARVIRNKRIYPGTVQGKLEQVKAELKEPSQVPLPLTVEAPAVTVEGVSALPPGARPGDTYVVTEQGSGALGMVRATAAQVLGGVTLRDLVVTIAGWIRGR